MAAFRHEKRYPNETPAYREVRDRLLDEERDLRDRTEAVAQARRSLPLGGPVKEDYVFREGSVAGVRDVRLSDLFGEHDSLLLYSYMYGPQAKAPCVMCTSLLDGLDGQAQHISQRMGIAAVARSDAERLHAWKASRPWPHLRLLSSEANTYNTDYFAETPDGLQWPACNVFVRRDGRIHHWWGAEVLFPEQEGQPRHIDMLWPLWNTLDLTPEGRGTDWYPRLSYE